MDGYSLKRIDELASVNYGAVKLAGDELGVESFGLQVLDLPPGFADYPEHDHTEDGQEEIYVVLSGQAELDVDGVAVALDAGSMARVEPTSRRRLVPGPDGVRILAIGSVPGGTYERPQAFRVAARA